MVLGILRNEQVPQVSDLVGNHIVQTRPPHVQHGKPSNFISNKACEETPTLVVTQSAQLHRSNAILPDITRGIKFGAGSFSVVLTR